MKKFFVLLLLALLLLALPTLAQEAEDLTARCEITLGSKAAAKARLYDRDYTTSWSGDNNRKTLAIKSPEPVHGLYICWMESPRAFVLEQKVDGRWQEQVVEAGPFQHAFYPISGVTELRIKPQGKAQKWFGIFEIFVLGAGDTPAYVQTWKEPGLTSDLLLLHAHPDDEVLFFGGTLPRYAGEEGREVVVAAITGANRTRVSELLNSLWTAGVKNYPVIGPFGDKYSSSLKEAYNTFGKSKVQRFAVELLRRYKPQVVVTHDVNGEYGHGMHRMCADAMLRAFDISDDAEKFADSASQFGTWKASKLYIHLYKENKIEMDWDVPLAAFSGKTGFEVAQEAYQMHKTQHRYQQFKVEPRDSKYSSFHYGLAKTAVGPDVEKNDFFENIPVNPNQVSGE